MDRTLDVAVVGCGGIGKAHVKAYLQVDGVRVAACVDRDETRAREAADLCGAQAITDIDRIPESITAVSVVTPPETHYGVVSYLLGHGRHVFCEKPLTMDVAQGEHLVTMADESQRVLMVGFKMRFEPIFQAAKAYLPEIGPLRMISGTKQQPYTPRPTGDWIPQVGAMYELAIHDFDLVHFITGLRPQRVLASHLDRAMGWSRENAFAITVAYDHDVIGQFAGMYATDATFQYRDITLTFLGERGYMRVERPDRIIVHTDDVQTHAIAPSERSAFSLELAHFRDVIQHGNENMIDADAGLLATRLIEAANAAAREHGPADC